MANMETLAAASNGRHVQDSVASSDGDEFSVTNFSMPIDVTNFSFNNMLYPREDRKNKILFYACRNCDYQEVANNNCVYRNEVYHTAAERTQLLADVMEDPSIPRTKDVKCSKCGNSEVAFFQATARGAERITLFFVCCKTSCGFKWKE